MTFTMILRKFDENLPNFGWEYIVFIIMLIDAILRRKTYFFVEYIEHEKKYPSSTCEHVLMKSKIKAIYQ